MLNTILYEKLTGLKLHLASFHKQTRETGTANSMEMKKSVFAKDRQHNLTCTCNSGLIAVSPGTVFGGISGLKLQF